MSIGVVTHGISSRQVGEVSPFGASRCGASTEVPSMHLALIGTVYPNSSLKCNLLIYFQDPISWFLPKSYKEHLVTVHVLHGAVNHAQCWPIGTLQA